MIWFGLYGSSDNTLQWIDGSDYDALYWTNANIWDTNLTHQPSMNKQCVALKMHGMNTSTPLWQAKQCHQKLYALCNECLLPTYYLSPNLFTAVGSGRFCGSQCNSTGLSVHSAQQNEFIMNEVIIKSTFTYNSGTYNGFNSFDDVWMGLNKFDNSTANWINDDGSPFDFGTNFGTTPWAAGEPSNHDNMEHCVQYTWITDYLYNDAYCAQSVINRALCNECDGKLHKYVIGDSYQSYEDANNRCLYYFGTTLASIHSEADNNYIGELCSIDRAVDDNDFECWVGFQDNNIKDTEGTFYWRDGTTKNYWSWAEGEPNGWLWGAGNAEDCARMHKYGDNNYGWIDRVCWELFSKYKFVCNMPSEICWPQLWFFEDSAHIVFSNMHTGCQLNINHDSVADKYLTLMEKQWINGNGKLLIEYTVSFDKQYGDIWWHGLFISSPIYNDTTIFVGFSAEGFVIQHHTNVHDEIDDLIILLSANTPVSMQTSVDYIVTIETFSDTEIIRATYSTYISTPAYNEIQSINISYSGFRAKHILFPQLSGNIGIANNGTDVTIKSLFVSGAVIYPNSYNLSVPIKHNIFNETIATPSPTTDTDPAVEVAVYLVITNSTENTPNIVKNVTIEVIKDVIENNGISEDCYTKPNISVNINNGSTFVTVSFALCNETKRNQLVAQIETDVFTKLLVEEIINKKINVQVNSTIISVRTLDVKAIFGDTIYIPNATRILRSTSFVTNDQENYGKSKNELNGFAIALIVIGCIVAFCLLICFIIFGVKIYEAKQQNMNESEELAKVNHSNMIQMDVMNKKIERINSNTVNESQMEEKQNTEYVTPDVQTFVAPKDDMIINGESDNNVTKGNETPHLNQVENEEFVVNTDSDGETAGNDEINTNQTIQ